MTATSRLASGALAPAMAVVVAMIVLQVGWGAPLGDALLYLGYEVGYRVLPGWLLLLVLSSRPGGPIRQLALGWALGAALEIVAFIVTAALDVRDVFSLYPLLVALPALAILSRRRRDGSLAATGEDPPNRREAWAVGTVGLLGIGLIALVNFPNTPLPGGGSYTYFLDYSWHIGLVAEARNNWPILDPNVAGEPFPYHYFVHIHMAGASQVTGIDIPTVFFRLYNLPLVLLAVLLFATAGRSLAGSVRIGLVAACLALFVGDLQLETSSDLVPHAPFLGVFVAFLSTSPSFLYGLTAFLALVVAIGERVAGGARGSAGDWVVVGLLVFTATGAKVAILPLVAIGLALLGAWILLDEHRTPTAVIASGALVATIGGITFLTQYLSHSSGLKINLFETFDQMPAINSMKAYLLDDGGGFPLEGTVVGVGAVLLGLVGMLAPQLAGLGWFGWPPRARPDRAVVWLGALLIGGILALLTLQSPGAGNQLYFVYYGVVAGCLLSAIGLRRAWRASPREVERPVTLAALVAGFVVALIALMRAPFAVDIFTGPFARAQTLILWYAGLLGLLALLALLAARLLRSRWWAAALLTAAVIGIGAMGSVANYVAPQLAGGTEPAEPAPSALTPDAHAGLVWIRENAPEDAVIAANNSDPFQFEYAAFAERRAFIQGFVYTREAFEVGYDRVLAGTADPFAEREALNAASFSGDPEALSTLSGEYGVRYLIVDPRGDLEPDLERLSRFADPVYENEDILILELGEPS